MRSLLSIVVLLLLVSLPGCLEFDAQEIVLRHDEAADRIEIMLVYRGLYAKGTVPERAIAAAIEDIDQARARGHAAFFSSFPFAVDPVDGMRRHADLLQHLDIENGGLFLDPDGRLCAYQFLRIRQAAAFLDKLNAAIYDLVLAGDLPPFLVREQGESTLGEQSLDNVRAARERGEALLTRSGGRLQLRLPLDGRDHKRLRACLADQLATAAAREMLTRTSVAQRRASGGSVTDMSVEQSDISIQGESLAAALRKTSSLRLVVDNELAVLRHDGVTVITLGDPSAGELRVVKASSGCYDDLLLQELVARRDEIESCLADEELMRRFTSFGRRAATLPEALRQARGGTELAPEGRAR